MKTKTVLVTVKIEIKASADAIEVINECDYNFKHKAIKDTEIVEIEKSN